MNIWIKVKTFTAHDIEHLSDFPGHHNEALRLDFPRNYR